MVRIDGVVDLSFLLGSDAWTGERPEVPSPVWFGSIIAASAPKR